jgi:transposase
MLALVDRGGRVPADHPLRTIKAMADQALEQRSSEFDPMDPAAGRASIPPKRLLKASLLLTLYAVRSERAFCEELDDSLLFRWFLASSPIRRRARTVVPTSMRER